MPRHQGPQFTPETEFLIIQAHANSVERQIQKLLYDQILQPESEHTEYDYAALKAIHDQDTLAMVMLSDKTHGLWIRKEG